MQGCVLKQTGFDQLPGWHDDDTAKAFDAFRRCAGVALRKEYRTGALGLTTADLKPALAAAAAMRRVTSTQARDFFETRFVPVAIRPAGSERGFVTGYYEPLVSAAPVACAKFRYPVYRTPPDLVKTDEDNPPTGLPGGYRFARAGIAGLEIHPDRAAIENGALSGRGLEIAWLASRVDLFFVHVQGAARLLMSDGSRRRITYAAKSGHPFTGPGKILADMGEIDPSKVTMQAIRAWFARHPDRIDEILQQNRSFIFFRFAEVDDPKLGPVAAAKVPLTPGRSLAVDRTIHTFATPFFVDAPDLRALENRAFRRLMIAQDTGSAITGPARGDLFFGSGDEAGEIAGVVKHCADFYMLVPKEAVGRLVS